MRFVAEFYLIKVKKITHSIIEAESLEGAISEAEGMEIDNFKSLEYIEQIQD